MVEGMGCGGRRICFFNGQPALAQAFDNANEALTEDIGNLGSVQSVMDIAEEELDLVQPGTVVYQPAP